MPDPDVVRRDDFEADRRGDIEGRFGVRAQVPVEHVVAEASAGAVGVPQYDVLAPFSDFGFAGEDAEFSGFERDGAYWGALPRISFARVVGKIKPEGVIIFHFPIEVLLLKKIGERGLEDRGRRAAVLLEAEFPAGDVGDG